MLYTMKFMFAHLLLIVGAGAWTGCRDDLPPYVSPVNPLEAEVTVQIDPMITYSHLDFNDVNTTRVTFGSPQPIFQVGLKNVSDETVEDAAEINGTLEVWYTEIPDVKVTLPLNATTINSSYYDETTGIITLDPGQTFWLKVFWNFRLDDKSWVFTKLKVQKEEAGGRMTRTHTPTQFSARASVQLFSKLAPSRSAPATFILSMQGTIIPTP